MRVKNNYQTTVVNSKAVVIILFCDYTITVLVIIEKTVGGRWVEFRSVSATVCDFGSSSYCSG